tara:strand:+ start:9368 stop:10198 length:831 start_codon:yes stop_codon:yes gene_type:complete
MAINLGNDYLTSLVDTGLSAIDGAFASNVGSDTTIKTALPAEAGIRNSLSFSNIRISFPTREGNIPFLSALTTNSLYFPAYIKSFEDNYSIGVTGEQVFGRTDPTPVYKGVTRTISVGLEIPCFDAADANENMKKINKFIHNLYPSYNSFKGDLVISSSPLIRVKFANLISNQLRGSGGLLGYVTNFKYDFTPSDGFYFSSKDGQQNSTNIFFRSYSLTFTFSVLHEDVVGFVDGRSNSSRDFPYKTNVDRFNPTEVFYGRNAPISQEASEEQQLG